MNAEETYRDWVQTHRRTELSPGFAEAVVDRIDRSGTNQYGAARWSSLLDRAAESPWARAAAIAVATAMGLGRILLTLHVLSFG